jgi:hypothetical protein
MLKSDKSYYFKSSPYRILYYVCKAVYVNVHEFVFYMYMYMQKSEAQEQPVSVNYSEDDRV